MLPKGALGSSLPFQPLYGPDRRRSVPQSATGFVLSHGVRRRAEFCSPLNDRFASSVIVRIYVIDDVDERLELMPMSARRALDCAGLRVSLKSWQAAPLASRLQLAELGSDVKVDVRAVEQLLTDNELERHEIEVLADPSPLATPSEVGAAFGVERPIPDAVWASLSPLDRCALRKVAKKPRAARIEAAYDEIVGKSALSTHLAPRGGVRMVNVSAKEESHRVASACSSVTMNQEAFSKLVAEENPKGDVLGTARLAGIMAAKRTSELIPLCHPLRVTKVNVSLESDAKTQKVVILTRVECIDRTGVEMEALTAASVAALTVYDMLKAFDKSMTIGPTKLVRKSGGRSGDYRNDSEMPVASSALISKGNS